MHPVKRMMREQGEVFEERAKQYGDNYKEIGAMLDALFPEGLSVDNPDDFNRLGVLIQMCSKLTRYTNAFRRGEGHDDSLADLAVYTTMLREIDQEIFS